MFKGMNKKGLIAGALTDFYAYVLFVFIFIIFLILFFFIPDKPESETLGADMRGIDSSVMMLSFLRTPVDGEKTMAEVIIETQAVEVKYRKQALTSTKINERFKSILDSTQRLEIEILYPDSNGQIDIMYGLGQEKYGEVSWPKTISLPSLDGNLIMVRLVFRK